MKLRVMITVLTVCCIAAGCHPDPFRSELKELDRIIAARQEYRDLFERKASPLRAGLDAALDDSIRFELEDSLRNYYLSFSLDSVERYTRKMAVSASTPRQRMKAELSEIRLVALKNMEMTALDLLSQIDTAAYDRSPADAPLDRYPSSRRGKAPPYYVSWNSAGFTPESGPSPLR